MGGGSKKGGGGSGGAAGGDFNIPQGLIQGAASETGLGQYGTSLLNPLAAMTGWASSLATGGQVNVPTPQAFAIQQGPAALAHGTGKEWASSFDPTTGLVTFTNPGNPRQTFQSDLTGVQQNFDIPSQVIQQWQQDANAYQQYQTSQTGTGAGQTGPAVPGLTYDYSTGRYQTYTDPTTGRSMAWDPSTQQWGDMANGVFYPRTGTQLTGAFTGAATPSSVQMGPQLSQAWSDIQAQQAATGQMPGIEAQTQAAINQAVADQAKYAGQGDVEYGQAGQFYTLGGQQEQQAQSIFGTAAGQEAQAGKFFQTGDVQEQQAQQLYGVGYNELSAADKQVVDANALVQMTTTGQGLFPAQEAMINQARQSEEQQLASTLGGVGLGRSTQLAQMTGAADQAAAATAGALQQGNIQAAEQVVSGALGQQAGAQKTLGLGQTGMATAAQTYGLGLTQEEIAGATRGQAISEQQAAAQTYGLGQTQEQIAQQSYNLSQAAQKISIAGQQLLAGEQAQLTTELQNITKQSADFQQQLWGQAMQGYGLMGNILSQSAGAYNYSLTAYSNVLNAMEQQNQIQAQQQTAAMQADQQGTSSLFSGLGSLFGSGGAGSNLLSGIGGAVGIGGAAAGAGAAASGVGAAAGVAGATEAVSAVAVAAV